jgi:DNA-binding IscR family transcriptional regulator
MGHSEDETGETQWTFLSNHAHVLVCLSRDPEMRVREIAARVGITERGVQRILAELRDAGVIRATKSGRRNQYEISHGAHLRHALESHSTVGELLSALSEAQNTARRNQNSAPQGRQLRSQSAPRPSSRSIAKRSVTPGS